VTNIFPCLRKGRNTEDEGRRYRTRSGKGRRKRERRVDRERKLRGDLKGDMERKRVTPGT